MAGIVSKERVLEVFPDMRFNQIEDINSGDCDDATYNFTVALVTKNEKELRQLILDYNPESPISKFMFRKNIKYRLDSIDANLSNRIVSAEKGDTSKWDFIDSVNNNLTKDIINHKYGVLYERELNSVYPEDLYSIDGNLDVIKLEELKSLEDKFIEQKKYIRKLVNKYENIVEAIILAKLLSGQKRQKYVFTVKSKEEAILARETVLYYNMICNCLEIAKNKSVVKPEDDEFNSFAPSNSF